MATYEKIFSEIILYLRQEFKIPEAIELGKDMSISRDLKIETDDISFLLIPDLEKKFAKKLSIEKWSKIETIDQIARAFSE